MNQQEPRMNIFDKLLAPFTGLYFASFPGIVDGGGAGGDTGGGDDGGAGGGGDDGGTGDDGDTGIVEGDEGEVDPDAEGVDSDTESGDEEDADGDGEAGEGSKDKGAKPTVESALNKFRKVDPKSAEVLRKEHFQNVQYRSAGSIQEVQGMKDFMTLHGGEEEIGNKIEQGDRFAVELDMVANGNKDIVTEIGRDSPEGLMKLGPHVLDEINRIDPKYFGKMMAAPMSRIMRETGVTPLLQSISRMIAAGQQKESLDSTKELLNWVSQLEALAEASKEAPITDRERKLQEQERGLGAEKTKIYQSSVGKAAIAKTNSSIAKQLSPLIAAAKTKGIVLTLEQRQDVASGIYTEIANSLKANTTYQRQMAAFYKRQADPDEIAEYVENQVNSLAEKATKAVWERKGWAARFGKKGTQTTTVNGRPQPAGFVSAPPRPENIDWSKDPSRARFMGDGKVGEATLKGTSKVVRFRWT